MLGFLFKKTKYNIVDIYTGDYVTNYVKSPTGKEVAVMHPHISYAKAFTKKEAKAILKNKHANSEFKSLLMHPVRNYS